MKLELVFNVVQVCSSRVTDIDCEKMSTRVDENRRPEEIVDLREDSLDYPVQCEDTGDSDVIAPAAQRNVTYSSDFIDLRRDVFPVQCTEASHLPLSPTCVAELTVRLDILLRKFHPPVHGRAQTSLTIRTSDLTAALHPSDVRRLS